MTDTFQPHSGLDNIFHIAPVLGWGTLATLALGFFFLAHAAIVSRLGRPPLQSILLIVSAILPAFSGLLFTFIGLWKAIRFIANPPSVASPHDFIEPLVWMPFPALVGICATLIALPLAAFTVLRGERDKKNPNQAIDLTPRSGA